MEVVWQAIADLSGWEFLAVLLALAYLLLAMRENIFCWLCAFLSTAIYTVLFWQVSLPMASLLNIYYMAMAVYGWYRWKQGNGEQKGLSIRRWSSSQHLLALGGILLVTLLNGLFLSSQTDAAKPFLDSFVTVASVLATWMMAQKILENWLYWIVIDLSAIMLYWDRELYMTLVLFGIYVVLSVSAWLTWQRHYQQQKVEISVGE